MVGVQEGRTWACGHSRSDGCGDVLSAHVPDLAYVPAEELSLRFNMTLLTSKNGKISHKSLGLTPFGKLAGVASLAQQAEGRARPDCCGGSLVTTLPRPRPSPLPSTRPLLTAASEGASSLLPPPSASPSRCGRGEYALPYGGDVVPRMGLCPSPS